MKSMNVMTKSACDASIIVLSSCDNIMCNSSCYNIQYVKLLEIIEGYINAN